MLCFVCAMLISLGQLRKGNAILYSSQPFLVLECAHHKMGRGGAVVRTKLKNLVSGSVVDETFQGNEKIELADISHQRAQYLYHDESGAHFMDEQYEQFSISADAIADQLRFLKDGQEVDVAYIEGKPMSIKLPPKVELKVVDAPPAVKGDTANSATKTITLETGLTVQAPLFVTQDETVRVNTETGEYVERVQ